VRRVRVCARSEGFFGQAGKHGLGTVRAGAGKLKRAESNYGTQPPADAGKHLIALCARIEGVAAGA